MKTKLIVTLFITFLSIPVSMFSQTIFYPDKYGLGYQYGYSRSMNTTINSSSIIGSFKCFDFAVSIGNMDYGNSLYNVYSYSLAYTFIKLNKKIYPTVSLTYAGGSDISIRSTLGIGLSIAGEIISEDYFKIIPEAGVSFATYLSEPNNWNTESNRPGLMTNNASMYCCVNFAGYIDNFIVLSITPGFQFITKDPAFILSLGAAYATDFK